mgnify:CR=1 FL=1
MFPQIQLIKIKTKNNYKMMNRNQSKPRKKQLRAISSSISSIHSFIH